MQAIGNATRDDHTAPWVNRLSTVVLTLMLLYAIVGIPEFNRNVVLEATDYVNPLNRVIWLGLLALAAPVALARWRTVLALMVSAWPLLLLYAYFTASSFWALDPDASSRRIIFSIVQLLLSVVLLSGLKRASTLHVLIAAVCVAAAVEDLAAWVLWPGYAMTEDGLAGLQLQKNQTGLLMMYGCLAATSAFFLLQGRLLRMAVAGAVAVMGLLLVATRSTTSQSIVLMAPIVMPALLLAARLPTRVIWALVAAGLAGLTALAFGYLAWCGLVNADPWLPMRGVTFTARTDLWSFALDEIAKRPWLGAGYSSLWAINPVVQPSLKSDMWFDARGQVIKTAAPGGVVQKTAYDGVGRTTVSSTTDGGGDSGYSDADYVTGDAVLEQAEYAYDADGNMITTTVRQRFHDETTTGALGTATFFRSSDSSVPPAM